jgi:hypothetical protein
VRGAVGGAVAIVECGSRRKGHLMDLGLGCFLQRLQLHRIDITYQECGPCCLLPDTKNKIGRSHNGRILRTRGGRAAGATRGRDSPAFLPWLSTLAILLYTRRRRRRILYIARVDTPRPTANRPHAGLQININANENQYSALLMAAAPHAVLIKLARRPHTLKQIAQILDKTFRPPRVCVVCALRVCPWPFSLLSLAISLGAHIHTCKPLRRHFSRLCPHRLILYLSLLGQLQFIFSD